MHGTNEIPGFLADLACRAAAGHLPLIVGLEIAERDVRAIRRYVGSAGTEQDRRELLAAPHWQMDLADGRSSAAILRLIERLRALTAAGARMDIVSVQAGGEEGAARSIVEARAAHPDSVVLALAGNNHTCLSDDCSPYRGFGWHLVHRHGVRVTSLNARTSGGTFWGVTGTARGLNHLGDQSPPTAADRRRIELWPARRGGFDGLFHVGRVTASFPAGSGAGESK
jgi:hypothetical protein